MSKSLFPAPIGTPVTDANGQFTIAWAKYFKALGDDLLTANKAADSNDKRWKYTISGNLCFWTWHADPANASEVEISLPFASLLAFAAGGTIYPPATKKITIPASATLLQGWYVVNFG